MSFCPQFLKPELAISNYDKDYNLLETPVFREPARKIKDGVDKEGKIDLLKISIAKIEATLKGAEPNQIKECLGRLALHKGIGAYNENQANVLINDYLRFLTNYPYDLLFKAIDDCILDPYMQYFPQIGRITDKMMGEIRLRQLFLGRLRKTLELSQFPEEKPMEPRPQELGAELAKRFKF